MMILSAMGTAAAATTVIVGLNAALQKRFVLSPPTPNLIPGNVHRAQSVSIGIGGKGQDVCVTLHCLRYCCCCPTADTANAAAVQLAQFLGRGPEGDQVALLLASTLKDYYYYAGAVADSDSSVAASATLTVRTQAPLRTCTSVVGADATTELVEPSGVVSPTEWNELLQRIRNCNAAGAVAFMGSLPPGCPTDAYALIYDALLLNNNKNSPPHNQICVIDSVAGLDELLHTMAQHHPGSTSGRGVRAVLKINASELVRLVALAPTHNNNENTDNDNDETAGVPMETIVQALTEFFVSKPAAVTALTAVALTDGAHAAHLAILDRSETTTADAETNEDSATTAFDLYRLQVPNLSKFRSSKAENAPNVLYPIGAGDAVAAGTLAAWQCLLHSNNNSNNNDDDDDDDIKDTTAAYSCLPPDLTEILRQRAAVTDTKDKILTTAFGFGLAVGSASCCQEENSVVDPQDCYQLFQQATPPAFLVRHLLPSRLGDKQQRAIAS